jgi:hypothetical protein
VVDSRTATFRQGATHDPLAAVAFTDAGIVNFVSQFPGGVTFRMVSGTLVIGGAGTVTADAIGNLSYQWGPTDLDIVGTYEAYFIGVDGVGRIETFPRAYNLIVVVIPTI